MTSKITEQSLSKVLDELIKFQSVVNEKDETIKMLNSKVVELQNKLNLFALDTPVKHRSHNKFSYKTTKSNFYTLVVKRKDGSLVEGKSSAEIFFNTIVEADPLKVRQLNIVKNGFNIVSNVVDNKYASHQKPVGNGWYVNTHSSTCLKKKFLDEINEKLNLGLTIDVVKQINKTKTKRYD